MTRSVEAGEILEMPSEPTLSDGTAGGIEPGAITFPLNQAVVDEWILVDEDEIVAAMRLYLGSESGAIEGAAGVAIAGLLASAAEIAGRNVVVLICGGNISAETLNLLD
jgi:threonine dehydratase